VNTAFQLDGRLHLAIADGGIAKTTFLIAKRTLWTNELSLNEIYPIILPFEWAIQSVYHGREKAIPLPPSYAIVSPGDPGVAIACEYTLTVGALKTQVFPLIKRRKR
jgi:hypothetical protein